MTSFTKVFHLAALTATAAIVIAATQDVAADTRGDAAAGKLLNTSFNLR